MFDSSKLTSPEKTIRSKTKSKKQQKKPVQKKEKTSESILSDSKSKNFLTNLAGYMRKNSSQKALHIDSCRPVKGSITAYLSKKF